MIDPRSLPLVTGRYQTWKPADGVPIRSTVGAPKFWRGPDLVFVRELAPYGIFGSDLPTDEARARYHDRLDQHAATIVEQLDEIAEAHPERTLVVCCFEDVHAGEECHRRWFAVWWHERYGVEVVEIGAEPEPHTGGGQLELWSPRD